MFPLIEDRLREPPLTLGGSLFACYHPGMNELLLMLTGIISAGFVYVAWSMGRERLYGVIVIFLILIASFGGKIVEFFGFETNTGNIFYASVFLATYFFIERYGRREGVYSIWVGIAGVVFFLALVQITVMLRGAEATSALNSAVAAAFEPMSRITLASLVAYALSQTLNVYLYALLKKRMNGTYLWLRANVFKSPLMMRMCDLSTKVFSGPESKSKGWLGICISI
jgi:queuosine precursor transporter